MTSVNINVSLFYSGILSTSNTIMAESSTDKSRAFGMTLLSTGWSLGMIVGPAVSGVLADPIGQYNLTLNSMCCNYYHSYRRHYCCACFSDGSVIGIILSRYPYSLPCVAHSLICLLSILVVVLCLPETRKIKYVY